MSRAKLSQAVTAAADRITGERWCFSSSHYTRAANFTRDRRKCDACLDKAAKRRGKPKPKPRAR